MRRFIYFINFMLFPIASFAYGGGDTPVSEGLSWITDSMVGKTGIALATIAIMGVGLACIYHYLEWKRLLQTVGGIAVIFGAASIVSAITGTVH